MSNYIADAVRSGELSKEQLGEIQQALQEKRGYTEPRRPVKAYGYADREDVDEVIKDLEESNVPEKTKKFLLRLLKKLKESEKTGEVFQPSLGEVSLQDKDSGVVRTFSVLPQEHRTGEEDTDFARWFVHEAGKEHQRKRRLLLDEEE